MIAQVLRFDEAYSYLKRIIDSGSLGALDNIYMDRHSVYPNWGSSFADNSVTGGCALDTHIHDVDMARYLLGEPSTVFSTEFNNPPSYQAVTTTLRFGKSTAVINCSWDASYEAPFTFGFLARFDEGTVSCKDGVVKLMKKGETPSIVSLPESDGVTEEIRYFSSLLLEGGENVKNPPESSMMSVRLVEKIRESSKSGSTVILQ
jgi:predicted dehydrogenase